MKSTSVRRAAIAALVLAPVLTACGFGVQTDQVYQPAEGVNNRESQVDVLNALVVSAEDGSGTFIASLVNNDIDQADELLSVNGPEITAGEAKIEIPADGRVNLADDGKISVEGDTIKAGYSVTVTLVFANADPVTLNVPVVLHDGIYADVPVPTKAGKPGETPSDLPTDTVTEEPTGSEGH